MALSLSRLALSTAVLTGIALLGGCQPPHPASRDPAAQEAAALEAQGYTHAPVISAVEAGERDFDVVSGQAPADSRVRFAFANPLKSASQAVGVTTDGQGRFHAEVPVTGNGGLYDITVDDGGRPRPAEGRLFIPPGRPDKAVLLRPGTTSRLVQPQAMGVMVADYDAAGAFALSGRVAPNADVTVIVNNEIRAEVRSDALGVFDAATQVPPPSATALPVSVIVQAVKQSFKRDLQVVAAQSTAKAGDQISMTAEGWRIDWQLPGGGKQSTVVFK